MKLMIFKHVNTALLLAAGLMFIGTSCSKVEDLYDPKGEDQSDGLLPNTSISSSFNWATSKSVDVRVAVDDQYNGQYSYKVELFDREPQAQGAVLLGAGAAKKGQDLVTQVTIPAGLTYIYVQTTTPTGAKSYTMLEVTSSTVVLAANSAKVASVNVSGLTRLASTTPPSTTPTFVRTVEPSVPTSANKLSGTSNIANTVNNGVYVIEAGATLSGSIDLANGKTGIVVYVKGTWDVPNEIITAENTNKIIVLSGGKITAKSIELKHTTKFNNYGSVKLTSLAMRNNGVVVENYSDLTVSQATEELNGSFYNLGTLDVKGNYSVTADPSFLYNEGTVKIGGTMTMASKASFLNYGITEIQKLTTANENVVANNGKMTINVAELNNVQFYVNCFTEVKDMTVTGQNELPKIFVKSDSKLEIGKLKSGSAVYNLEAGSILNVSGKATFTTARNKIVGLSGAKKAVAIFGEVVSEGWEAITYSGTNLEVVTVKHTQNTDQWDRKYIVDGASLKVGSNVPSTVIASTECNAGGAGVPPVTPPVDQTPTEVALGTYSYAFEDNWPSKGDYDMNDLVVDVQVVKYQNKANKVEKVVLKNKIRSLGAKYRLAAAIQLDNVLSGNVKSVAYSKSNVVGTGVGVLPQSSTGVESGQAKAVVTIVDDAHTAFGQSATGATQFVFTDGTGVSPFETEVTITFNTPVDNFTQNDLNPFIVVNYDAATSGGKRKEVHLVGSSATDKMITSLISKGRTDGMLSSTDPFKTNRNEPFALSLPQSFVYPKEAVSIDKTYPSFVDWVTSGGTTNQDWYNRIGQ